MRRADENDKSDILKLLERDIGNCVYIYIDVLKYGFGQDSVISVWVDGNPINLLFMKYHDSIQVYGRLGKTQSDDITGLIKKLAPHMIYGEKSLVLSLHALVEATGNYAVTSGAVFEFLAYRKCPSDNIVALSSSDMRQAAELVLMDKGFASNYDADGLTRQMSERLKTNMGRNYGIYQDGMLVAHIASFAEYGGIAVTSGLIVHPAYRSKPYGSILESYLVNTLLEEKYKVYTFVNDPLRIRLLKAMGCRLCGEYAKLVVGE